MDTKKVQLGFCLTLAPTFDAEEGDDTCNDDECEEEDVECEDLSLSLCRCLLLLLLEPYLSLSDFDLSRLLSLLLLLLLLLLCFSRSPDEPLLPPSLVLELVRYLWSWKGFIFDCACVCIPQDAGDNVRLQILP